MFKEKGKLANPFKKRVFIILVLLITITGIFLRLFNSTNVNKLSPDENIFLQQARTIVVYGLGAVKTMVHDYNIQKELWMYPSPHRVGYILPLAAFMKITGIYDARIGIYISCFASILTMVIILLIGLRFFNQWITLFALLFFSVSPMALAVARRTWQEALLGFIGILMLYCMCEITRNSKKVMWFVLFVLLGSYCMVIKSTGIIVYGLCVIWVFWVLIKEKSFSKLFFLIFISGLGAGAAICFLIKIVGGVDPLMNLYKNLKYGVVTSEYARENASGPWYHYFEMLWMLCPLSTILFIYCIIMKLLLVILQNVLSYLKKKKQELFANSKTLSEIYKKSVIAKGAENDVACCVIYFVIAFLAFLFIAKEHSLNLRYAGVIYAPFYLLCGLGLWYTIMFFRWISRSFAQYVIIPCVIIVLVVTPYDDYRNFKKYIVKSGIVDLSIGLFRGVNLYYYWNKT
ncbi:glycosyltransferase family 39 protein [Chlamydiota bacterium]